MDLASEFEQIKRHPEIGAKILGGIRQMTEVVAGVLSHHERFDGSGYPHGLHGRQIPQTGRIVMLADSFDAMISERTYRRALPVIAAQAEIRRFEGTQFDPDISDVFLNSDIEQLLARLGEIKAHRPMVSALHIPVMN